MKQQPQARTVWRIEVIEAGAMSSQLFVRSATDKPLTDEQLAEARLVVDQALSQPGNEEWLEATHPWVLSPAIRVPSPWPYDVPASCWRSISGLFKETRVLVAKLNKTNQP